MRLVPVLLLLALVATATASAAGPVQASMSTTSTAPVAGTPWRYVIDVTDRAGKPLAARVRLQALRGDVVVGCWRNAAMRTCSGADAGAWIAFNGTRSGTVRWPASMAGGKLTFRATVVTGTRSLRLRAPVAVLLP